MALKIVYPVCCGIDVHKTFVVACIASTKTAKASRLTNAIAFQPLPKD
ncbi:hypothetical protein [Effusibacillus consociatus]|uniref:IS110 family transposase n=1 Tax=Effusibacillus consociatus TaxID=1117041 RepID=A0ABV9PYH0_9BACL